ncbi:MAG: glutamate racemase [Acutalibacteraceae bacterium]
MSQQAIGVFDSGLGGLTTVKELMNVLPNENIIYFGDTERVPYGNRSRDTIIKFGMQDANFLLSKDVKFIIAACGTVSSVAKDVMYSTLPVPYTGVVVPTAKSAVKATKNKKIGVIGTSATINSHSYKNLIEEYNSSISVYEQDCPLFVPLVENGFTSPSDQIVRLTIERYLSPLVKSGIDTLILGCTHYPILMEAISSVIGKDITLINAGAETALYAKGILAEKGLLNSEKNTGNASFYVSDKPDGFTKMAEIFLSQNMEHSVQQIDITKY